MSNKTRKHIRLGALALSLAIVGVLAAFVVLAGNPATTAAHSGGAAGSHCEGASDAFKNSHDALTPADHPKCEDDAAPTREPTDPLANVPVPKYLMLDALDNGARLSWHALPDSEDYTVTGYQIDRKVYHSDRAILALLRKNGGDATIDIDVKHQYRDLGLSYGTTYTYRVRAEVEVTNAAGEKEMGHGPWSRERTIVTADSGGRLAPLLETPSAVRDLKLDRACAISITVSWKEPDNFGTVPATDGNGMYTGPDYTGGEGAGKEEVGKKATSVTYKVERKVGNGSWAPVTHNGMEYVDSRVEYDHTYTYRVRARNSHGLYGPWTTETETLVEPPAPEPPASLVVNLEEDQEGFELQWDSPKDLADPKLWRTEPDFEKGKKAGDYKSSKLKYTIQRQVGDDSWVTIKKEPHQYSRDGLTTVRTQEFIHSADTDDDFSLSAIRGKQVRYRVAAEVDDCNRSMWNQADEVEVPAATVPEMPTGLTPTPMGQNQIDLSWTAPADGGSPITEYTFEYSTDGGSTWSDPAATDSMTSHSHTGLTADTTYHYRVMAVNAVGSSMASATRMATTAAAPALGTITDLALSNSLELSWTAPAGAAAQIAIVVNAADDTDFCLAPLGGDVSSYTCSRLDTTGNVYVGLVIAQDGRGGSTISNFPIRTVQ